MTVILIFLSTLTFSEEASRLLVTSTEDVTVLCSVSSSIKVFGEEKVTFLDVQIRGRFGAHGEEHALVTLTRAGAFQSNFLKASYLMSQVSGNVTERDEYFEAWVTLTIARCDYGQFICVLSYVNGTADSDHVPSTWRLGPINYIPGNKAFKTNGVNLSLQVQPGLSLLCEHTAKDQTHVTSIAIKTGQIRTCVLASWPERPIYCTEDVVCSPASFVANDVSFRAHVLNTTRHDWGQFVCTIDTYGEDKPTIVLEESAEAVGAMDCRTEHIAIGCLSTGIVAVGIFCIVLVCKRSNTKEATVDNAPSNPADVNTEKEELKEVLPTSPDTPRKSRKIRKRGGKK